MSIKKKPSFIDTIYVIESSDDTECNTSIVTLSVSMCVNKQRISEG